VTIWSVLSIITTTVIFLCYSIALFCYFRRDAKISWRLNANSILSTLNLMIFVFFLYTRTIDPVAAALGICIQMLSAALFAWAAKSTFRRRLSVAYNRDIPEFILETGPFGLVRHPFYASYVLFWFSFVVIHPSLINAAFAVVIFVFYLNAARFEETKFARSSLAPAYRHYSSRTGMFLPRIS
jgi:protein-S-isoprenylcysteine O-methyltransferase Ste14